jgi:hypothetical protein
MVDENLGINEKLAWACRCRYWQRRRAILHLMYDTYMLLLKSL